MAHIYISGPVTGLPMDNRPAFMEAEDLLLERGHSVFNPAHIAPPMARLHGDALWRYYMHHCVRALPDCDGIYMLPKWQLSRGALWEHNIACMLGLTVEYAPCQ